MSRREVALTVRGATPDVVVESAIRAGFLPSRPPDKVAADKGQDGWLARFARTATSAQLTWGSTDEPEAAAGHAQGATTIVSALDPVRDDVLARLEQLPFTLASFATLHAAWRRPPHNYRAPSFGELMPRHGWACAFRGEGHRRLVSRRWLSHGPWRLRRGANDLSIVEFHDSAADADTALQQARPGHARMGIGNEGGYIQPAFVYSSSPKGFYDPSSKLLKIVVHGRPLTQRELLEACALRIETREVEPGPVSNVAYVFMEESEARANLHELWLRGLECRCIRDGAEVRIDEQYDPPAVLPDWAR